MTRLQTRQRVVRQARHILCLSAAVSVLITTGLAQADEVIPTVTVTADGPDRSIPAGSSYYIAGVAAKDIDRVRVAIVRTHSPNLFDPSGDSCVEYAKRIDATVNDETARALDDGVVGLVTASSVWVPKSGESLNEATYVAPTWVRPADAQPNAPFKILIPYDRQFQREGGTFCLFITKRQRATTSDVETLRAILLRYVTRLDACARAPDAGACMSEVERWRDDAVTKALAALPTAEHAPLQQAVEDANEAASKAVVHDRTVRSMLDTWKRPASAAEGAFVAGAPVPSSHLLTKDPPDPLAHALARLLVGKGVLTVAERSARFIVTTKAGAKTVTSISILSDGDALKLGGVDEEVPQLPRLSDLVLPFQAPGNGVTVRDLLELTEANIRVGKRYIAIDDLYAPFNRSGAISDEDIKLVTDGAAQLGALSDAIDLLYAKASPGQSTNETLAMDALRDFLGPRLVPCREPVVVAWQLGTTTPTCAAAGTAWPGFATGSNPLGLLGGRLGSLLDARRKLEAANLAIETKTFRAQPFAPVVNQRVTFSQESWVFTYLTPVVGMAVPIGPDSPFSMPYLGVQVHFWPNPVEEPLWTNGCRDLLRAFALEAGVATTNGPFGESSRFGGWQTLPPLFLGAAVHLLPYTSISAGGTLLDVRTSTLEEEDPSAYFSGYVGLSVQANVPDLVKQLAEGDTTTTTQGK